MLVSAFSVRSNANGRMRVSASVSKTVQSIVKTIAGQNGLLDFSFKPHAFRLRFLTKESAPAGIAAIAIADTYPALPVPWLGSTIMGR